MAALSEVIISGTADAALELPLAVQPVAPAAARRSASPDQRGAHMPVATAADDEAAAPPAAGFTAYHKTMRLMSVRRLTRELKGTYSKPHPWRTALWILAFIFLEIGLATFSLTEAGALTIDLQVNLVTNLLGLLVNILLLYVALRVVSVVRWCVFWVAAGSVLTLILTGSPKIDFGIDGLSSTAKGTSIGIAVGVLCSLHLIMWFLVHHVYPRALATGGLCTANLQRFYSVRPAAGRPGHYTYRAPATFCFCWKRTTHTFGYEGELDADGRPHGLGTWTDDAKHGESLQGVWSHGEPIGPFRASEFSTDYRFSSVRVAFVTDRAEPAHTRWFRPTFSKAGLRWGVASVECSIAGAWFRNLPNARVLEETVRPTSGEPHGAGARWCLERLLSLQPLSSRSSQQLLISAHGGELHVAGHELQPGTDGTTLTIQLVGAPGTAAPPVPGATPGAEPPLQLSSAPAPPDAELLELLRPAAAGSRRESSELRRQARLSQASDDADDGCSDSGSDIGGPATVRQTSFSGRAAQQVDAAAVPLLRNSARPQREHPTLSVLNRTPTDAAPPEAVIYLPGFNASVQDQLLVAGQLLTLADIPAHIKFFLFSWPGGRELTYFTAMNHTFDERTQADFAQLVASIIDAGVKEIHLLCHSAGSHVMLSALHLIEPMLLSCAQQERAQWPRSAPPAVVGGPAGPLPTARLATVMLISPDYPLQRFVHTSFPQLRRLCKQITLYCDTSDGALKYSEMFNRDAQGRRVLTLGKNPFMLVRSGSAAEAAAAEAEAEAAEAAEAADTAVLGAPAVDAGARAERKASGGFMSWAASMTDVMASVTSRRRPEAVQERDLASRVTQTGEPLDMDVIDTSWMDSNVQGLRHNYFNVNRWMLDDIRETLIFKRRAHTRTGRMTHRRGNVWSFIGAPKYIVNQS